MSLFALDYINVNVISPMLPAPCPAWLPHTPPIVITMNILQLPAKATLFIVQSNTL